MPHLIPGGTLSTALFRSRARDTSSTVAGSTVRTLLAAGIFGAGAHPVLSQEALRRSIDGEEMAAMRRNVLQNQAANLQWGLTKFMVGGSFGVEWNDNVDYSDANQQKDVVLRPAFSGAVSIPFTEENALFASIEIGYAKYLRFPEHDRLIISPGTQVGFDVYVKDFHFNLHDRVSITEQPVAQGTISGEGDYGEFSNTAGVGVDWDLNEAILSLGYEHENAIGTSSTFSYLDRSVENFVGRIGIQPSQDWSYGPEVSAGFTSYDEPVLNDSQNYSIGGFATWQPTPLFHANLRAGYTAFLFQSEPNQRPTPDVANYYLGLQVAHRVNEIATLSVDAGRQVRLGINSELLDLWYARPKIDWHVLEKVNLDTHMTFESGTDTGNSVRGISEVYTLLGGGMTAGYQIIEKLGLGLGYDYTVKDSNAALRKYHQHRIQIRIQYTF